MSDFNAFRFAGLEHYDVSRRFMSMNRIDAEKTRVVIRFAESHVFKTQYGYGLILDRTHVLWLKDWQVSDNCYGVEVVLTKQYFTPKAAAKPFSDFDDNPDMLAWEEIVRIAEEQAETPVRWGK